MIKSNRETVKIFLSRSNDRGYETAQPTGKSKLTSLLKESRCSWKTWPLKS